MAAQEWGATLAETEDRWIAIAMDHQIVPGSSNPILLRGIPLAAWRPSQGPVNVWEDRCPHRGMRLSFGFVQDDMLRCIYHGWGYAPGGKCMSIPAHPALEPPKTICANTYPSETRFGMVWTNLATEPAAQLPEAGKDEDWVPVRSIYVNRPENSVRQGVSEIEHRDGGSVDVCDNFVLVDRAGDGTLLMAVQPVDEMRTALHIAARGKGVSTIPARLGLAERMLRLRGELEAR